VLLPPAPVELELPFPAWVPLDPVVDPLPPAERLEVPDVLPEPVLLLPPAVLPEAVPDPVVPVDREPVADDEPDEDSMFDNM